MLWSNLIASSKASDICNLIGTTMSANKSADIVDMLNVLVQVDIPKEKLSPIIDTIESYYIEGCELDLAPYLAILYYRAETHYLSKYYLGLITNIDEEIKELIKPLVEDFTEENELECPAESISQHNFKTEYIYNGEKKEYSVHSFSQTIGKNATVLKTPYGAIMFDCGAACGIDETDVITEIELLEFFQKIDISPDDLLAVVISHAHLDHYGSIVTLLNLGIEKNKIYIEDTTKSLIQQVATGIPSLEEIFPVNAFFMPFQKIKITAFPNGHILGSTGYIVTFDERNVVYTGDYSVHDQRTVEGLNISALCHDKYIYQYGVDCLITETTYGRRSAPIEYENVSKVFLHFVNLLIRHGFKVFIPSFAVGRSQEIALLLNEENSVLIDGMAAKISRIYEDVSGIKIFNRNTRYNDNFEDDKEDNFDCNDIIIASSGMLSQNSTSYNYVKSFLSSNRKIAIIKTGYISSESYGNELLNEWKGQNDRLFDISLSAHADFDEIYTLISNLEPRNIVCIHGDGLKASFTPEEEVDFSQDTEAYEIPTSSVDEIELTDDTPIIDSTQQETTVVANSEQSNITNETDTDDIREEDNPNAYLEISFEVMDEVTAEPNDFIVSLFLGFIDAFVATDKESRNAPLSHKNEKLYGIYYELYSYVRLHKEYSHLYKALFDLGAKKGKVYSYLYVILKKLGYFAKDNDEAATEEISEIKWQSDSILYVHKGTIICQRDEHNVIAATAVFTGKNDSTIELSVNYCKDCNRFFINYVSYEEYRNRYGILIGNIVLEDEQKNTLSDIVLADASPLKLCGYSVNQQDAYTKETRQYIISKIIEQGIMPKSEIIRYLEYFININGRRKGNDLAVSKWRDDLNFTLAYEIHNQDHYKIDEVKRYR